jgi:hypothetical protein
MQTTLARAYCAVSGTNTASPEIILKENSAKTLTLVGAKAVNSFQYKGRKMGCNHVIPTAPFAFNERRQTNLKTASAEK